jgi:phosphate transport system protein
MGLLVEAALCVSAQSLGTAGAPPVEAIIDSENLINRLEMEIDEGAIRLLALHQPVACDLRFLTSALKMTTDLERMGDLATNIARRAAELGEVPQNTEVFQNMTSVEEIRKMAAYVCAMVTHAWDDFERNDASMASLVLKEDDIADRFLTSITGSLLAAVTGSPNFAETAFGLMFIARHLERIADHATNIAEDVLYLLSGVDVRHHMSQVA